MTRHRPWEQIATLPPERRMGAFERNLKKSTRLVWNFIRARQGWFTKGDLQDARLGTSAERRLRELREWVVLAGVGEIERQRVQGKSFSKFRFVSGGQPQRAQSEQRTQRINNGAEKKEYQARGTPARRVTISELPLFANLSPGGRA